MLVVVACSTAKLKSVDSTNSGQAEAGGAPGAAGSRSGAGGGSGGSAGNTASVGGNGAEPANETSQVNGSTGTRRGDHPALGGSTVGITKNAIKISVSAPFSGVYGPIFNELYADGMQTWQDEVNAKGGIYGRQVLLTKIDNQLTADGAVAACKEAQSNGTFMVMVMTSTTGEDDCEDAAGIPVFDGGPASLNRWRNVIVGHVGPAWAKAQVSFLKSHYVMAGAKKIGIIYVGDIPTFIPEYQAVVAELKRQGLRFVHAERISSNQASFVPEMSRMRDSGAQTVLQYVALEGSGIIRDAKAIGYNPQWYASPGAGSITDIGSKTGNENFQGLLGLRWYTTTETPAFAQYIAKVRKYQGDATARRADSTSMAIYGLGDTLGRLLGQAGPTLTRQSFLASARTIDYYDNGYLVPFTLKRNAVPVAELSLFPVQCCKSDYTWRVLGPAKEQF